MMNNKNLLNEIQNIHYPSGPVHTNLNKLRALSCLEESKDLEAVYHLVESHMPNLRITAALRYEKTVQSGDAGVLPINKENIKFNCSAVTTDNKIANMLAQLEEMPEEWTVVQLTSQFNVKESLEVNSEKFYTNPIHITVFNCGNNQMCPFTMTVGAPVDQISGSVIELRQEMHSILNDHVHNLQSVKYKQTQNELLKFSKCRLSINDRLADLVRQMQNKWLGEWRCLLVGKFVNSEVEDKIMSKIEDIFVQKKCQDKIRKSKSLLYYLIRGAHVLAVTELSAALRYLYPEPEYKNLRVSLAKAIGDLSKEHNLEKEIRHPLILVVDEKLDFLPWEMIDVMQGQAVSRMPSLHFTYALFKEHADTIVKGFKITSQNGKYILNPGSDLKQMERRLHSFFRYWVPQWPGSVGVMPSENNFADILTSSDIFVYSGHGNGSQFLAGEKIQKLRVNAVVLLFGCGSVQLTSVSPQVEMFGTSQMYLIACSPCVVGMLWMVTDADTDAITAEFLSQWVPSKAPTHWKLVNRKLWSSTGALDFNKAFADFSNSGKHEPDLRKHEPDLLRAVSKARKAAKNYIIQAACVARGLPVKIQ